MVLILIASGRFRIELAAVAGLLLLGIAGAAPPGVVFSGFGHPALATIIAVFFISQGIVSSGLMRGLGQKLAGRLHSVRSQILGVAAVGAILSAFMNNVGAAGLMLPTAVRMAARTGSSPGSYGLPLAMGSILGGTITLIGSAPNIIIAAYKFNATGSSFKMFDYAPHGLAMLLTALLLWLLCRGCGLDPGTGPGCDMQTPPQERTASADAGLNEKVPFAPLATRERVITLFAIVAAVLPVSFGLLHPAFGFGGAALVMILGGVLKPPAAYDCVDLKIVFFLGAMLGIGQILEHTGSLELISLILGRHAEGYSLFWLVTIILFASSALSNAINNAAAAVFMAPLALGIAAAGTINPAAALMAVAAGSNLTLLLPTHQASLLVLSKAPFSTVSFIRFGIVLTIFCGLAAAGMITLVWG